MCTLLVLFDRWVSGAEGRGGKSFCLLQREHTVTGLTVKLLEPTLLCELKTLLVGSRNLSLSAAVRQLSATFAAHRYADCHPIKKTKQNKMLVPTDC